jgi:hypothetical protein
MAAAIVPVKCKCGRRLLRWDIQPWVGGYTVQQCDRAGCTRRHVWAATSVDIYAAVGYARQGAGCDVYSAPGKLWMLGGCKSWDELHELAIAELGVDRAPAPASARPATRVGLGLDQVALDEAYKAALEREEPKRRGGKRTRRR